MPQPGQSGAKTGAGIGNEAAGEAEKRRRSTRPRTGLRKIEAKEARTWDRVVFRLYGGRKVRFYIGDGFRK